MNIAYSCAGEGYGHASRLVALYPELIKRHHITLFIPQSVQPFIASKLGRVPMKTIPCLEFEKKDNKIIYWKSFINSLRRLPACISAVLSISRELKTLGIDVVISDFDPILVYGAKLAGIPVLQLNHPGIVHKYISMDPRSWFTSLAARILEGPATRRIHISFYNGDVGPLIRSSLLEKAITDNGTIVINVKGKARKKLIPILKELPHYSFDIFPRPGGDFETALASCSAVITTAGHQTISEALVLGKPILAIPQESQFEQILNARMLAKTGRGSFCFMGMTPKKLPNFLANLERYKKQSPATAYFCLQNDFKHLLFLIERSIEHFTNKKPLVEMTENQDVIQANR